MRYLASHENTTRGTSDFPLELYYVDMLKQSSVIFDKMVQIKYQTFIDAVFGDSAMYGSGGKKGGIPRMQCV